MIERVGTALGQAPGSLGGGPRPDRRARAAGSHRGRTRPPDRHPQQRRPTRAGAPGRGRRGADGRRGPPRSQASDGRPGTEHGRRPSAYTHPDPRSGPLLAIPWISSPGQTGTGRRGSTRPALLGDPALPGYPALPFSHHGVRDGLGRRWPDALLRRLGSRGRFGSGAKGGVSGAWRARPPASIRSASSPPVRPRRHRRSRRPRQQPSRWRAERGDHPRGHRILRHRSTSSAITRDPVVPRCATTILVWTAMRPGSVCARLRASAPCRPSTRSGTAAR